MALPLFLAEDGFSPPWIERHGLPGSFWLLFKVCESGRHGKNNKVNWDRQDTEGHILNKVQNREPPKSVIWTVLSVWICQVCQVITKGFKHTTSSPRFSLSWKEKSSVWSLQSTTSQKRKGSRKRAACLQINATSMPVLSRPAADGKAEQKKCTRTFHTQLDPGWPDLQSLWAKETIK